MRSIRRLFRIRKRRIIYTIMMLLAIHDRIDAQATPTPTPIPIDAGGLYEGLIEGNDSITGLNPDLSAPGGIGLLPSEDGQEVFSYAKWLISPSSADEIAGPFAPIIVHIGFFLSLLVGVAVVYGVVYAGVYLIRFAIWIFRLILQFIQIVVSVVGAIIGFFF